MSARGISNTSFDFTTDASIVETTTNISGSGFMLKNQYKIFIHPLASGKMKKLDNNCDTIVYIASKIRFVDPTKRSNSGDIPTGSSDLQLTDDELLTRVQRIINFVYKILENSENCRKIWYKLFINN